MRRHLVVTTGTLIAVMVVLSACGSSSKKSNAGSGSTTSAPSSSSTPAGGSLTCTTFTGTLTVTPPLSPTTSETHTLSATGKLSGCTGTPGITSGDLTFTAKPADKLNCSQLIAYTKPTTSTVTIKWDNGKTSTGDNFTVAFEQVTKTTISGSFSGGDVFVGKTATTATQNTPDGNGCTAQGVSLNTASLALASPFTVS